MGGGRSADSRDSGSVRAGRAAARRWTASQGPLLDGAGSVNARQLGSSFPISAPHQAPWTVHSRSSTLGGPIRVPLRITGDTGDVIWCGPAECVFVLGNQPPTSLVVSQGIRWASNHVTVDSVVVLGENVGSPSNSTHKARKGRSKDWSRATEAGRSRNTEVGHAKR